MSMTYVLEPQLAGIGAPHFCCSEVESETTEHKYDVNGAFIHSCPFQESFKGTMFSPTDSHMKKFIANAILSAVHKSDNNVGQK